MINIYVLKDHSDYDIQPVLGVYSTQEKAELAQDKYSSRFKYKVHYPIETYVLDAAPE